MTETTNTISLLPETIIPEELKQLRQWVLWAYEQRNGKRTKVPKTWKNGDKKAVNADVTDPKSYMTYENALGAMTVCGAKIGIDGMGFVFTEADPYCGIDFDDCCGWNEKNEFQIETPVHKIIQKLQSYTELSPSRKGVHVIIKGKIPPGGNRKQNSKIKVEMYDHSRFFCMTGSNFPSLPSTLKDRQKELEELHSEIFGKPETDEKAPKVAAQPLDIADEEIIEKAKAATNGAKFSELWAGEWKGRYPSQSEADIALCSILAFWCGNDPGRIYQLFRQSGLMRPKWNSKRGDSTYGQQTIARACAQIVETYTPKSTSPEIASNEASQEETKPEDDQHQQTSGSSGMSSLDMFFKTSGIYALTEKSTNDEIISPLRVLADQTKELDQLSRLGIREGAVKKLKEIGIQSPTALVDAALSLYQQKQDAEGITFAEQEPYQGVVEGDVLLDNITSLIKKYIFLPKYAAETAALWILHAHALKAFVISAFLAITSPEKRCGKTALLEIIGGMVPRPLFASNITAPALFRAVEKYTPTLLIDEADTFLHNSDELRGVLNSGHRRKSAFVVRCVGDDSEPRQFRTWCPKAIARIGELPDTLADRSIVISMIRKSSEDKIERLRLDQIERELNEICRQAAKWAGDNLDSIRSSDPEVPGELNDRAADNWRPLITIAEQAGGKWLGIARDAAKSLSGIVAGEQSSYRAQLLIDIKSTFESCGQEAIASTELATTLSGMEDRRWGEWKKGKPITPIQIASLLKPFKIAPHQVWINQANYRGYAITDFKDAFSRYIPPSKVLDPLDPNRDAGASHISEVLEGETPNTPKTTASDSKQKVLTPLTPQNPPPEPTPPSEEPWRRELSERLRAIKQKEQAQSGGGT